MFAPLSMNQLAEWVFAELDSRDSIFGIPKELFFHPSAADGFRLRHYGRPLDTPFGVAAGPHSQLAHNILVAWLCGARFIELKTVQTLDELEIPRPCIDMQDEGYNVEWSQELTLDQSFDAYLQAWVMIHALHHRLGHPGSHPGVIFNMSVGYDLAGLQQPNMQKFLRQMADAGDRLAQYVDDVGLHEPGLRQHRPAACISDNVTVSTMHGCPPAEIGNICTYLMEEWGLHTNVKLNPTLLGPERARYILSDALGFRQVEVPDLAFEHDLKYPDALSLIAQQQATAAAQGVEFGVKLCNTLEVVNQRETFRPGRGGPEMAYLSGRPHHVLTVNLAHQLLEDCDGDLSLSFAGGADAWNVVDLLGAGMTTVTTCSDLLRPGGYGRLAQYIEQTAAALADAGARSLPELICARGPSTHESAAAGSGGPAPDRVAASRRANLGRYARQLLDDPRFKRDTYQRQRTKTNRTLGTFDCIAAPCMDHCPIHQQVPRYLDLIAQGAPVEAAAVIREDNALAAVLGRACNHACETVCVQSHYDAPVAIRELKRFALEGEPAPPHEPGAEDQPVAEAPIAGAQVAIVGAGPCGLSTAYFLRRAGYRVTLFEARKEAGGMVSDTIPAYRATQAVIDQDLNFLGRLGVELQSGSLGQTIHLEQLRRQYSHVVLATGAPAGLALGIPGEKGPGVHDGLTFLRQARRRAAPSLGAGPVAVIGGGDVAMDCARTADRLAPGRVTLLYRRTLEEMPAHREEREALLAEGIQVRELVSPERVVRDAAGELTALVAQPIKLGAVDSDGRRRPVRSSAPPEELPLSALIVAIGQQPDLTAFDAPAGSRQGEQEPLRRSGRGYIAVDAVTRETSRRRLYAGGDLTEEGPATIVAALADGKAIARSIRADVEDAPPTEVVAQHQEKELHQLIRQRARRTARVAVPHRPVSQRQGFDEILGTLGQQAARAEAARCLRCDRFCGICVSVCPNRACLTYQPPTLTVKLPRFCSLDGHWRPDGEETFRVSQPFQVLVVKDFCNECGNCATFCPTTGRPYQDKPQLYLSARKFREQRDNAYHIHRQQGSWGIEARLAGATHRLQVGDHLAYGSPALEATLTGEDLSVTDWTVTAPESGEPQGLGHCVTMYAVLQGARASLGHLPLETVA